MVAARSHPDIGGSTFVHEFWGKKAQPKRLWSGQQEVCTLLRQFAMSFSKSVLQSVIVIAAEGFECD